MSTRFFGFYQLNNRISRLIIIMLGMLFILPEVTFSGSEPEIKNKVKIVVIDPGHGGKDPGALGRATREKDIVLAVALKVGEYIEKNYDDVKVIYTRKDDTFVPLDERASIANKNKADLFISIHANASPKKVSYGAETFVMGHHRNESNLEVAKLENSVITLEEDYSAKYEGFDPDNAESYIIFSLLQYTHLEQSLNFARLLQDQFREKARRNDRGVKQAGFGVLWQTTMPSVLVELGFISHPEEEKYLSSKQGQYHLASSIYRAFRDYKNEIESSSIFETVVRKNEDIFEAPSSDRLYFKVQLFSSQNKLSLSDKVFEGFSFPEEFTSEKWTKYAVGHYPDYKEASLFCNSVQSGFPGAFVIAVKDGQIIPVNEAISELSDRNK